MNEILQGKADLMLQNAETLRKSAKLDFSQAANLGALMFTSQNLLASENDIRANRKLLKSCTGFFSNFRGSAINLSLLTQMCMADDPMEYLEQVIAAYSIIREPKIFKSEQLVYTAMCVVQDTDPTEYRNAAEAAWKTLDKMSESHPLITGQEDLTLAHMLCNAGIDVDTLLEEAEQIYAILKPTGFKLKKNTLQNVSLILALSEKPIQEKCDRFMELREALKSIGRRIYGEELAIVAAFVDIDAPVEQIATEIGEMEESLKHQRGFGALVGGNTRRLYASALVLQAYDEMGLGDDKGYGQVISTHVVQQIIMQIVMTIIMTSIITTTAVSSVH